MGKKKANWMIKETNRKKKKSKKRQWKLQLHILNVENYGTPTHTKGKGKYNLRK